MTSRVTPAHPLGWELETGPYSAHRECIGSFETTTAGNIALRIGAPVNGNRDEGWYQAAYVVLTPREALWLARELESAAEEG